MLSPRPDSELTPTAGNATVPSEASPSLALEGDFERVARRRYQHPKPFREGNYWWIKLRTDVFVAGKLGRKQKRLKLAPANTKEREVLKIVDEYLRPINQNLESIGSATNFTTYVNETYIPVVLPLMATSTQARYRGVITNYLLPAFWKLCLRDFGRLQLQKYLSAMSTSTLTHESRDKI